MRRSCSREDDAVIFVTVGTTLAFDALIEAVDRMVENDEIDEKVVCQIGHGTYLPRACEHFRFTADIEDWMRKATVVIGHGGTGTVSSLLAEGKPFVAVANPAGADDHQAAFLSRLSQNLSFLWTRDLADLPRLVKLAPSFEMGGKSGQRLAEDLRRYLLENAT